MVVAFTSIGKISIFQKEVHIEGEYTNYVPELWGPLIGLHLIALGTGGIKPCVSSFGGDQFKKSEASNSIQNYYPKLKQLVMIPLLFAGR